MCVLLNSTILLSCNSVPVRIIDQNIKLQYPAREAGQKMAFYKIQLITKCASSNLQFDSAKLESRMSTIRLWDSKQNEINSFNKGDTLVLDFTYIGGDLNLSDLDHTPLKIFYQYKTKPKKLILNKFKILGGPISN